MNATTKKHLILRRGQSTDQGTPGALYDGDRRICCTLELPWRDNDPASDGDDIVSSIPAGTYEVAYLARSASGKYTDVYQVLKVRGRSGILIHAANYAGDTSKGYVSDLLGCIAPCRSIGKLTPAGRKKQQTAGIGSRAAMNDLHAVTGRLGFTLEIRDAEVV